MRDSCVFFRSFYEAIKELPKENQLELYDAIFEYSLNGIEPNDLMGLAKSIFTLIKPTIESCNRRYKASVENGKKGGRPKKIENLEKPKKNLKKPSQNLYEDVDVDEDVDEDVDVNDITTTSIYEFVESCFGRTLSPFEIEMLDGWVKEFDIDLLKEAFKISTMNRKRVFSYVKGILNNWKGSDIKSVQDLQQTKTEKEEESVELPKELEDYNWFDE